MPNDDTPIMLFLPVIASSLELLLLTIEGSSTGDGAEVGAIIGAGVGTGVGAEAGDGAEGGVGTRTDGASPSIIGRQLQMSSGVS